MGYGGNLIWSSVFHAWREHVQDNEPAIACATPMLTDVLAGRLWRADISYRDDTIFRFNPDVKHVDVKKKSIPVSFVDRIFEKVISIDFLRRKWENFIFQKSQNAFHQGKIPCLMHIDMRIHSYAEAQTARNTIWKKGGCASHVIAQAFGLSIISPKAQMEFSPAERKEIDQLLEVHNIRGPFVVIEPDTNRDWFGDLRAWPEQSWHDCIEQISRNHPELTLVQVGVSGKVPLKNVVSLVDKLTFRQTALVMEKAGLFVGTEGGLMHVASAVDCKSVILWGGITLPEFAGYPDQHHILCHYVSCAPCGNLGWCDNNHKCMREITVDEVMTAISRELENAGKDKT